MATPKAKNIDKVAIFAWNDTDKIWESIETTADGMSVIINNSLVTVAFDYIALTYVGATEDISTVVYKTGGAGGATVATLTLTYDGSTRLETITKT